MRPSIPVLRSTLTCALTQNYGLHCGVSLILIHTASSATQRLRTFLVFLAEHCSVPESLSNLRIAGISSRSSLLFRRTSQLPLERPCGVLLYPLSSRVAISISCTLQNGAYTLGSSTGSKVVHTDVLRGNTEIS